MSVVVWDGRTLATDRLAQCAGHGFSVTKSHQLENGEVVAWTGTQQSGHLIAEWYEKGADPAQWPAFQLGEDWSRLIILHTSRVLARLGCYEKLAFEEPIEEPFFAFGAGRDLALGALAMGADAVTAVRIACQFCIDCGAGIDAYDTAEFPPKHWTVRGKDFERFMLEAPITLRPASKENHRPIFEANSVLTKTELQLIDFLSPGSLRTGTIRQELHSSFPNPESEKFLDTTPRSGVKLP